MSENLFFGVSLTASFLAGTLALFAPCCITFLLPSYLGTIFKSGKLVTFYTLIFALGISSVLIPVALGFRIITQFFDLYHQQVYYLGGFFLILMGLMTLKPVFHLPQIFHFQPSFNKNTNSFSVFGLGVMSGLTSSCCAPVLFAAVTLTSLSPNLFQALIVAAAYVVGIVFPLFLLSLFYEKTLGRKFTQNRRSFYSVFKILGALTFTISGIVILILAYLGKIEMKQMEGYSLASQRLVFGIAKYFQNPLIDVLTFGLILFFFYKIAKRK